MRCLWLSKVWLQNISRTLFFLVCRFFQIIISKTLLLIWVKHQTYRYVFPIRLLTFPLVTLSHYNIQSVIEKKKDLNLRTSPFLIISPKVFNTTKTAFKLFFLVFSCIIWLNLSWVPAVERAIYHDMKTQKFFFFFVKSTTCTCRLNGVKVIFPELLG